MKRKRQLLWRKRLSKNVKACTLREKENVCARAGPLLRRLPVIRKPSSDIYFNTSRFLSFTRLCPTFSSVLNEKMEMRRGIKTRHENELKWTQMELKEYKTRPWAHTFLENGFGSSCLRWCEIDSWKRWHDETDDANASETRLRENDTAYTPSRGVRHTRNGKKRKKKD